VSAGCAQTFVLLVLFERDFGTAVILELSIITLLYLGGAPLRALLLAGAMLIPVAAFLIRSQPYRLARVKAFLDPFADRRGAGYQLGEALITIGSGGLFGVGLGDGRQKLFFLPEAHTDFIFAIIGEELGFVGICLLVLLFAAYLWVSFSIARKQTDLFARYFVFGLAAWIVMQAATNMAVATGLLPTKGLTLPFISSGGSSLLICSLATGLIMSAAREVES
jgi:cell division protein FtsW